MVHDSVVVIGLTGGTSLAEECHCALVGLARALIKGLAVGDGRGVEVEGYCLVTVTGVFHTMKTYRIWERERERE